MLFGGISLVTLHSIFDAFSAAADNIERRFFIRNPVIPRP